MSVNAEQYGNAPSPHKLKAEVAAIRRQPQLMNNLPNDLPFGPTRSMMRHILDASTDPGDNEVSTTITAYWLAGLEKIDAIDESIHAHRIDMLHIEALQNARGSDVPNAAAIAAGELALLIIPVYEDLRKLGYGETELAGG